MRYYCVNLELLSNQHISMQVDAESPKEAVRVVLHQIHLADRYKRVTKLTGNFQLTVPYAQVWLLGGTRENESYYTLS